MRRHRPVMNALRGQIRKLEGNPGLPGGVIPPSVAWLEANCSVTEHDYGNNNVQYNYVCEHWGSGGRKYRCTWSRWSNSNTVQLLECTEITRPYYHDIHGGSEGPQSYGTLPPYVPGRAPTEAAVGAGLVSANQPNAYAQQYHYGRWAVRNPIPAVQKIREAVWQGSPAHEITHVTTRHAGNPGPYTPVCPAGQEPCGTTTSGDVMCCDIEIKGPTPAGASRRSGLTLRDRLRLSYRLLFTSR